MLLLLLLLLHSEEGVAVMPRNTHSVTTADTVSVTEGVTTSYMLISKTPPKQVKTHINWFQRLYMKKSL